MLTLYVPSWSMRCPSAFLSDGDLAIIAATSDPVIAGAAGAPAGACPRCAQIANVSNVTKLVAAIIRITMQPPLVPYVQRRYGNRRISSILFASRGALSTWECDGAGAQPIQVLQRLVELWRSVAFLMHSWMPDDSATPGDRKSTRLNSSHVSISYAVFCLK